MMLSFNPILAMKADNPLKYTQNFPSPMPNLSTKVLLRGFQFKSGFLQVAPNRTNLHTGPTGYFRTPIYSLLKSSLTVY